MQVHVFNKQSPSEDLQNKLFEFEKSFSYQLSKHRHFYIDHSPDYSAFYRAMGDANIIIIEKNQKVIAVISAVVREIEINNQLEKIAYIGDLKIQEEYRRGPVLFRLFQKLQCILKDLKYGYAVVVEGTEVTPEHYTGRLGIPVFSETNKIQVLRFNLQDSRADSCIEMPEIFEMPKFCDFESGFEIYQEILGNHPMMIAKAKPEIRSSIAPQWMHLESLEGRACGMLDDTRKAERWYGLENSKELRYANIGYFVYQDPKAALSLIKSFMHAAKNTGYDGLSIALTEAQFLELSPYLQHLDHEKQMATLYATHGHFKNLAINASEI